VLAGAGGIQGSLDGVSFPFPSWGGGSWLNDEQAVVSHQITGVPTDPQGLCTWDPGNVPVQIGPSPNDFSAGGDSYVAWRAGYGVFGTLERFFDRATLAIAGTAGPRACAPDGTVAFIPDRQYGYGIRIVARDGSVTEVPGIAPTDVQTLGPGVAIWSHGAVGRPALRPALSDAQGVQVHRFNQQDWLLYWSDAAGLVLQVDGASEGWVLDSRPLEFNPSCAVVVDELQIAWSTTQGEGPQDIVVCALTSNNTIVYIRTANGVQPATPRWRPLVVTVYPAYHFTHPVNVNPFKAEGSGQADLFTLGTFSEDPVPPSPLPEGRLLLCHDGEQDWGVPAGLLRSYDMIGWELYLLPSETLSQSATRWMRQAKSNLSQWPKDCFVVPMFYDQMRWTVQQILDALTYLSDVVNLSPRIKVIAPFAYNRANGIVKYPELQKSYGDLVAASIAAGHVELEPVPGPTPPDPVPPDPPIPPKPISIYTLHKEHVMSDTSTVTCGGPQGKLARIDPAEAGKGPFGWYPIHWDGVDPNDPNCRWVQTKPDTKFKLAHQSTGAMLGADPTLFGADPVHPFDISKQFYGKPGDHPDGRGAYESVSIYDGNLNKALQGVIEFTPDAGGFLGFSAAFTVTVVQ
jgi:hypothetical protein